MPEAVLYTAEMVRNMPDDGNRYEVVDGALLVTPSPRFVHQYGVLALLKRLGPFVEQHHIGLALFSPADIEFDVHSLVQPDLFVMPLTEGRTPKNWNEVYGLILAIEVLSPSTARADRTVKRRKYQRGGVPEYWIVDLDARLVERWRPADERPEVVTTTLVWQATASAGLEIDLPAMFAEVLDS